MKKEMMQYYKLCLWFVMNQNSNKYSASEFRAVLQKIGDLETKLHQQGVSEARIQKLIDQVARAYMESTRLSNVTTGTKEVYERTN